MPMWRKASCLLCAGFASCRFYVDLGVSTAISACEKGGQWQLALQLFNDMPMSELKPDVFTYNATLSSCATGLFCLGA